MTASDGSPAAASAAQYPAATRGPVVDEHHGTKVADPYRWMETPGPEVSAWVAAQNELSQPYLDAIPAREPLRARLTELWDYEQYGLDDKSLDGKSRVPFKRGGRYFFVEKSGKQNQGVLYWTPTLAATPRVLVDPNTLSDDATASLANYSISPDGRYVAYAVSDGGTDWKTWHVREVETGRDLPELIRDTKFTGVSWMPDADAFYYSRYPRGVDGRGDDQQQVSVYRHRLGTAQEADEPVYATPDNPRHNPYGYVSDDGRWLVFVISYGYDSNAIHLRDLSRPDAPVVRILDKWDGLYEFLGAVGDRLYFKTTQGAPRGRVIAIEPGKTESESPAPVEIVPEAAATLHQASVVGGHVIANYLEDARSRLRVHRMDGSLRGEVRLPGLGTVIGFPDAPK
jgi:prolyl oligopeptidase